MNRKTRVWKAASGVALLVVAALGTAAVAQESGRNGVAVRHPNLLLNPKEIEQIKLKIKEHAWAARSSTASRTRPKRTVPRPRRRSPTP